MKLFATAQRAPPRPTRKIQHAIRHCPKVVNVGSGYTETKTTIVARDAALPADQITDVGLVKGPSASTQWAAQTFMYNGPLFSGIYAFAASRPSVLMVDRKLAAISARKLH
jgi:hypothetical protein